MKSPPKRGRTLAQASCHSPHADHFDRITAVLRRPADFKAQLTAGARDRELAPRNLSATRPRVRVSRNFANSTRVGIAERISRISRLALARAQPRRRSKAFTPRNFTVHTSRRNNPSAMMLALLPLGAVKLPAWFSDNMVLQTDTANGARSFLSGLAAPHETVHATIACNAARRRRPSSSALTAARRGAACRARRPTWPESW